MRVKRGSNRVETRKKVLKLAKGYYLTKHNAYRIAKLQVERSLQFAYRDRRQRKRHDALPVDRPHQRGGPPVRDDLLAAHRGAQGGGAT